MRPEASACLERSVLDRLGDQLGDPGALARLVGLYVDRLDDRCADIEAAVSERDPEGMARAAHLLKSSSGTFGAVAIAGVCAELENAGRQGQLGSAAELLERLREACVWTKRMLEPYRTG